jgi:hypothetical protein
MSVLAARSDAAGALGAGAGDTSERQLRLRRSGLGLPASL